MIRPEMDVRSPIRHSKNQVQIEVVPARTGVPVPVVNGKFLHSRYDPVDEARKWVKDQLGRGREPRVVVVLGLGFAYHVKALREVLPKAHIVVLEPISEIALAYAKAISKDIDRVQLWPSPSPQQTVDAVAEAVTPALLNHTRILAHPPSLELASGAYRSIMDSIHSTLDLLAMSLTTGWGFGFEWIQNGLQNVRRLPELPVLNQILNFSPGRPPCLVLGAGPSLNDQWETIRTAKTLLLASDTALEPMEQRGLRPHLGFSLDGQIENAQLLDGVDAPNLNLVVSLEVQPSVFARNWRNLIVCSCDVGILTWLERRGGFSAGGLKQGGSVVTCAFDYARQLRASAIYLAGVDLSFTGHSVYCRGTAYERRAVAGQGRFIPVEQYLYDMKRDRAERTVSGRQTQDSLFNYYRWMKDEIGRTECPVLTLNDQSLLAEIIPSDGLSKIQADRIPESFDEKFYFKKLPANAFLRAADLKDALDLLKSKFEEFLSPDAYRDPDRLDRALEESEIKEVIETVAEPAIAVSRYEIQKGKSGLSILQELREKLSVLLNYF